MNCFAVTGVWTGFDKNWLIEKIATSLKKRNKFIKKINTLKFILFSSCISNTLKKLKSLFNKSVCSTSQV